MKSLSWAKQVIEDNPGTYNEDEWYYFLSLIRGSPDDDAYVHAVRYNSFDIEATQLRVLDYEPYDTQMPIFSHLTWSGLESHLILGKHEYDIFTAEDYDGPSSFTQRVASIDGYTTQIQDTRYSWNDGAGDHFVDTVSGNISHAQAEVPNDTDDGNSWLVNASKQAEMATDPINMGLWFRPYLLDGSGAIEMNPVMSSQAYASMLSSTLNSYWWHSERYNVGAGTIQAGDNGKGLVSMMPMFDWNGTNRQSLTGVAYGTQATYYGGSDIRGMIADRGIGGIANSPSTRDYLRSAISMGNAAMMVTMAIENVMVNIVRDNNTSNTNFLNPQFDNGEIKDKYPYEQVTDDDERAIRINDTYGPGILDNPVPDTTYGDDYASYPLYTGTYGKYVWANLGIMDMDDESEDGKFRIVSDTTGDNWTYTIGDFVGTVDSLTTSVGLEIGDSGLGTYLDQVQYLSLVNLSFDGNRDNRKVMASAMFGTDFGSNTNDYSVSIDDTSGYVFHAGVQQSVSRGSETGTNFLEWDIYPRSENDSNLSKNVDFTYDTSEPMSTQLHYETGLQREVILYNPVVGIQNNRYRYELDVGREGGPSLPDEFAFRHLYPQSSNPVSENYGGRIPWSVESPVITQDDLGQIAAYSNSSSDPWVLEASARYEDGTPIAEVDSLYSDMWYDGVDSYLTTKFYPENVVDTLTNALNDGLYGGWRAYEEVYDNPTGQATQWLAKEPDATHGRTVLEVTMNRDVNDYYTKTIQIAPAMNCRLQDEGAGYDMTQVWADSVKHVLYEAYDSTTSGNLVDRRILNFQEWQVADYVIHYEESIPIGRIELTILDVYWDDYSLAGNSSIGNTHTNYGGFSEITWYLDNVQPTPDYCQIEVEYVNLYGEDSIRYQAQERGSGPTATKGSNPDLIDAGDYFLDVGNNEQIGLVGINGMVYVGTSKNDRATNERYQVGTQARITGHNANLSNQLTREFYEEVERQNAAMREQQKFQQGLNILLVSALVSFVLAFIWAAPAAIAAHGILGGLAAAGLTAVGTAAMSASTSYLVYYGFMAGFEWLATENPELALWAGATMDYWFDGVFYQFIDEVVCGSIDAVFHTDSIKVIGPLFFGLYTWTLDIRGTQPRWLTVNYMNEHYPLGDRDWRHIIFEKYEMAMYEGRHYDWSQYGSDHGL